MKLAAQRDLKREAKKWNVTRFTDSRDEVTYSKGMDRHVGQYEVSLLLQLSQEQDIKFSIQQVERDVQYSYFRGSEVLDYQIDEEESFDTQRKEMMLYGTWNFPVLQEQRTQLGFHCNQAKIENIDNPEENLEVKAQFA